MAGRLNYLIGVVMETIDQNLNEQLVLLQTRGATLMQERKEFFAKMYEDWENEIDDAYEPIAWYDMWDDE
jgi:hypothetical protein